MATSQVFLQPRRASPFYGRHPWVYPGAIARVDGEPADGDEVDLHAHDGGFIARGLYNGRSRIRVRLYCWPLHNRYKGRTFFELERVGAPSRWNTLRALRVLTLA